MKIDKFNLVFKVGVRLFLLSPVFVGLLRGDVPSVLIFPFLALTFASVFDVIDIFITDAHVERMEEEIKILKGEKSERIYEEV